MNRCNLKNTNVKIGDKYSIKTLDANILKTKLPKSIAYPVSHQFIEINTIDKDGKSCF